MTDKPMIVWEGVYATFAETGADPAVFEGAQWLERIVERAQLFLDRSTGATIPPVAVHTEYALSFVAALAARRGRPLRILDFGGSMATTYVPLRAMLPKEQAIDFVVVENAAICERGKQLFAKDEGVHFRTDLPPPTERFDIVHFGSSLHYIDDWQAMLATAKAFQPEYLLFVDLTAADNCSFVTTQLFQGRRIPVRFWNVDEFVASVCALGFDILLRARYRGYYSDENAERPTTNFDEAHRLRYTSQLVFRRTKEE